MDGLSAHDLYVLSLRTGKRLPEHLHGAMLLWSFDDKCQAIVKDYMEWVEHCQNRDERESRLRKRMQHIERNERLLGLFATVAMFLFAVVAVALKK